jgi:hypothetical protein
VARAGHGVELHGCTLRGSADEGGATLVEADTGSNITLHDTTLRDGRQGLQLRGDASADLHDVTVERFSAMGVAAESAHCVVTVVGSSVRDCGECALYVGGNATLRDSVFTGSGWSHVVFATTSKVEPAHVASCRFEASQQYGIVLKRDARASRRDQAVADAMTTNNVFADNELGSVNLET